MITNKQRNLYKYIKSNEKIGKLSFFEGEECKIAEQLEELNFLEKKFDVNGNSYFKLTQKELPRKIRETAYKKLIVHYKSGDIQVPIKRCEKPKFGGRGRKWEFKQHNIKDTEGKIHLDVNWGNYIYLSAPDNRWYKIEINPIYEYLDEHIESTIKTINDLIDNYDLSCEFKY